MSDVKLKKIDHYLDGKQHLKNLFFKIKQLNTFNDILKKELDSTLANYCQVANLVDDRLILLVANASVATHIRFQSIALLQKIKQHEALRGVSELKCIVRPYTEILAERSRQAAPKTIPLMSTDTASFIKKSAASLASPLKEIMLRIARHTKV